jgi:L-rhamnose mutarotase
LSSAQLHDCCLATQWGLFGADFPPAPLPDSIFHDPETNILFGSFKYVGYDLAGDMERMRENPRVQEWWRMTDSYQESFVEGAKSSSDGEPAWWKGLQEVFYTP